MCCPVEDEVYMQSAETKATESPAIRQVEPPLMRVPTPVPPPNHNPSFRNHKNFGKLPPFQKCSLSLTSYLRKARGGKQTFRGQFPWVALLGYRSKFFRLAILFIHFLICNF